MAESFSWLVVVALFLGLLGLLVVQLSKGGIVQHKERGSSTYASSIEQARLRSAVILGHFANLASDDKQKAANPKGVRDNSLIIYSGESHLLTVGSTRSGKGVGAIIPNLLQYAGSVLVIDPKGENVAKTAHIRKQMGHNVIVLDPWKLSPWQSCTYNPFDEFTTTSETLVEDARLLAESLVVSSLDLSQHFFEEEAKSVLSTIIAFLLTSGEGPSLTSLIEILGQKDSEVVEFFDKLTQNQELDGFISRGATRFVDKAPNELSGVLSTARQHIEFLDATAMKRVLSSSSLRLSILRERPTTIYLVIPVWRLQRYNRWLRLMLTMALTELSEVKPEQTISVLVIIDEFASLGLLPSFETAFALMAGLGVQLWPIIQDFTQLKRLYGENWETFVANAGVLQFFGTRDLLTASYISGRMGPSTIIIQERSTAYSDTTEHERLEQRPLKYPDEIIKLDANFGITFVENSQPIIFKKIKYFEEAIFSESAIKAAIEKNEQKTG